MAVNLRALTKEEQQLLSKLNGAERFLQNYNPNTDALQVSMRLKGLEGILDKFYEVRSKIELASAERQARTVKGDDEQVEDEVDEQVLQEFEDRYYALQAQLSALQSRSMPGEGGSQPVLQMQNVPRVKLPEIHLPRFNGRLQEWVTFRDTFQSLIDNNNHLSDLEKFTYLRSSLEGPALQEINSVELTAANYSVAWEALVKRFENRKLIVKAHLDALFALQVLRKESYEGLNHLISEFEKNLQMLEKIGENTTDWSTILAYMLSTRLDSSTLRLWETHHNSKEVPTYKEMLVFLQNHCSVLQSVAPVRPILTEMKSHRASLCNTSVRTMSRCIFCNASWHPVFQCQKFQRWTVSQRNDVVVKNNLCRNCLRAGHYAQTCERGCCRHCQQKHHSLLHKSKPSVPQSFTESQNLSPQSQQTRLKQVMYSNQQTHTANNTKPIDSNTQSATAHTATSQACVALPVTPTPHVLLSTAVIKLTDRFGHSMLARALLDSCSQHCLMSKGFSTKLKFHETPSFLAVQGIGSSQCVSNKVVSAVVTPRTSTISPFQAEMQFHVLPKLTISLPTSSFDINKWKLPVQASLADPMFNKSGPIDVIIGAEFYIDLLRSERCKATKEGPTLQNSVFGWIVSGRVSSDKYNHNTQSLVHVGSTFELQNQLSKFWELETCRSLSSHSVEETACEEFFIETTTRDASGRFIVSLPKKPCVISRLGESKSIATKRFLGLERRLDNNPELREQYAKFLHEYLDLGHMREVTEDLLNEPHYYMPHHAVIKPDSTTTKLRVVFDASCRTASGVSLNDALMVGPIVQEELLNIVLRFRMHRFALVADITKMYRMVRMHADDQALQRIVWRHSASEPLRTFELTTVTYGTASAPYLATKCLERLAEDGSKSHPIGSRVIHRDFYVDDMLSGADNIEGAGIQLQKRQSNSSVLLENVLSICKTIALL